LTLLRGGGGGGGRGKGGGGGGGGALGGENEILLPNLISYSPLFLFGIA
jgi:hypothetical protein